MIKSLLCAAGVVACGVALAPSAQADGFYINPEWNGAWSGSNFGGAVMDAGIGYEKGAFLASSLVANLPSKLKS